MRRANPGERYRFFAPKLDDRVLSYAVGHEDPAPLMRHPTRGAGAEAVRVLLKLLSGPLFCSAFDSESCVSDARSASRWARRPATREVGRPDVLIGEDAEFISEEHALRLQAVAGDPQIYALGWKFPWHFEPFEPQGLGPGPSAVAAGRHSSPWVGGSPSRHRIPRPPVEPVVGQSRIARLRLDRRIPGTSRTPTTRAIRAGRSTGSTRNWRAAARCAGTGPTWSPCTLAPTTCAAATAPTRRRTGCGRSSNASSSGHPRPTVLVATLVPSLDSATNARIQQYNARIPGLVEELDSNGLPVRLVDMSAVTSADMTDGLHPNSTGDPRWPKPTTGPVQQRARRRSDQAADDRRQPGVRFLTTPPTSGPRPKGWTYAGQIASGVNVDRKQVRLGDFNGDGRADYAAVGDQGQVRLWLNRPSGNGVGWDYRGQVAAGRAPATRSASPTSTEMTATTTWSSGTRERSRGG